jgi:hypothetical protein
MVHQLRFRCLHQVLVTICQLVRFIPECVGREAVRHELHRIHIAVGLAGRSLEINERCRSIPDDRVYRPDLRRQSDGTVSCVHIQVYAEGFFNSDDFTVRVMAIHE